MRLCPFGQGELVKKGPSFLVVFVLISALSGTSGAGDGGASASGRTENSVGTVDDYSARSRAFSVLDERGHAIRFTWTNETKFNGVVSRGVKVAVRYTLRPDGQAVAKTVGVVK